MPATREQISAILQSPDFSDGEKFVVRAQYRATIPMGNFEEKLWEILCAADDDNFAKLTRAYPAEARAVYSWRYGQLGERIREAGLNI